MSMCLFNHFQTSPQGSRVFFVVINQLSPGLANQYTMLSVLVMEFMAEDGLFQRLRLI